MYNFINKCIGGDASLKEVDTYIEYWHTNNITIPLYQFLGMTEKEYSEFVKDENYLGTIFNAHKKQFQKASTIGGKS